MSATWSFVDQSGRVTGQTFTGPHSALAANTPDGCRAVEGLLPFERGDDPQLKRDRVLAQIAALELRQARPLRELQIDPANFNAAHRLAEIEADIAKLRAQL